MSCYFDGATGLSSQTIAFVFAGHKPSRPDHPYDPADLIRCRNYCRARGITDEVLAQRMTPVSPQWAALAAEWPELLRLLAEEEAECTGMAPRTYKRMKDLLAEVSRGCWETR